MKKFISTILLVITLTNTASAVSSSNFTDVNENTHYKGAIDWMAHNKIVQGYSNGTFGPDICVKRAELLKMLFETLEINISSYQDSLFSDTPADHWYAQYVIAGRARGTITGYPDGTFKPEQCVNRVEAIKIAILEFNNGEIPEQYGIFTNPYDIAKIKDNPWWMPYFKSAMGSYSIGTTHFSRFDGDWSDLGVDSEFANPTYNFGPAEPMTRKEVAEMLYRMKTMQDNDMDHYFSGYSPTNIILNQPTLTIEEVRSIAENSFCGQEGKLSNDDPSYHEPSDQWYIDVFALNCAAQCSIDDKAKTAEINYMCTGAL